MLDLNALKKQLDEALEKETTESLTNWLKEKRKVDNSFYLGEGELYDMNVECFASSSNVVTEIEYKFESKAQYFVFNFDKAA